MSNFNRDSRSKTKGFWLSLSVHLVLVLLLYSAHLSANQPESHNLEVEVVLSDVKPLHTKIKSGKEPMVEKPDPNKEIRLTQRSEAAVKGKGENKADNAKIGDEGDVKRIEPPREPEINKRALFPSKKNSDSTDFQKAKNISDKLSAGHTEGNTKQGRTDGKPSAKLAGRSVMGSLPAPEYNINEYGSVIVKIQVDQYGNVVNAIPGIAGTTVQSRTLWEAARSAAMKAKFNVSSSAPPVQEGTITYIFQLK